MRMVEVLTFLQRYFMVDMGTFVFGWGFNVSATGSLWLAWLRYLFGWGLNVSAAVPLRLTLLRLFSDDESTFLQQEIFCWHCSVNCWLMAQRFCNVVFMVGLVTLSFRLRRQRFWNMKFLVGMDPLTFVWEFNVSETGSYMVGCHGNSSISLDRQTAGRLQVSVCADEGVLK